MKRIVQLAVVFGAVAVASFAGPVQGPYSTSAVPQSVIETARHEQPSTLKERILARLSFWHASRAALKGKAASQTVVGASLTPTEGASPSEELLMCVLGVSLMGAGLAGRKRREQND